MVELLEDLQNTTPWCEKYRPILTNEILYHENIIYAFNSYLDEKKFPHIIMTGSAGVGKSTTIIAFAKKFYGESFDEMTLILNASEERGIETIRTKVKQFVTTHGDAKCKTFKMVIMDEMDSMTADAQAMLRKIIETYTYNVRFCFICNYIKKISIAIQNRCVVFKFRPIPHNIMREKINKITLLEDMNITNDGINLILKVANGDMRKLLNILQSLNMIKQDYYNSINEQNNKISNNEQNNKISNNNTKFIITEQNVSKILSSPTKQMISELLNNFQTKSLKECHYYVISLFQTAEITLLELLHTVYDICMDYIINDNTTYLKYPIEKVVKIINNLAIIDTNLSNCNDENIQIMSFTALFFL